MYSREAIFKDARRRSRNNQSVFNFSSSGSLKSRFGTVTYKSGSIFLVCYGPTLRLSHSLRALDGLARHRADSERGKGSLPDLLLLYDLDKYLDVDLLLLEANPHPLPEKEEDRDFGRTERKGVVSRFSGIQIRV